jgi:hypothetical protein
VAKEKGSRGHVLTKPQAPAKIGQGVGDRVTKAVDNTGKALGALAGFGVFFFATGYLVEWQRMKRGGLPPEQVLPLVPKTQIAAAGVRELAVSLLLGGSILILLMFVMVWLVKLTDARKGRFAQGLNHLLEKEVAVATVLIGIVSVLIVPFDALGLLVAATVTGLFCYGLHLVRGFLAAGEEAQFPLWQLTAAIALAAIVLIGIRQHEFPEPRAMAIAVLKDGKRLKVAYVSSDSDKILLRRQHGERPTELLVVHESDLASLRMIKSTYVYPPDGSLLDGIVGLVDPGFKLSCIPPECRWDESVRIGPSRLF